MEELRSTEVLDREIRIDSNKKAEKILKKAQESADVLLGGVEERLKEAEKNARDAMNERLLLHEKNAGSSIPLEKQRYLVTYIYSSLVQQMNSYFENLGEEKQLSIIEGMVKKSLRYIEKTKTNAYVAGFNLAKAKSMLKKCLGTSLAAVEAVQENFLGDDLVSGFTCKKGVILKTDDEKTTSRLTLEEAAKSILDEKSEELALALFNGRLPE